ncbi:hypothetical protein VNO77_03810 [Canavalia gladiata]|uniref:Uncharacterized protein n=1 Tax=Canavalia gladiata TaxID=3824 RepID=A0AAN9R771_CANGL
MERDGGDPSKGMLKSSRALIESFVARLCSQPYRSKKKGGKFYHSSPRMSELRTSKEGRKDKPKLSDSDSETRVLILILLLLSKVTSYGGPSSKSQRKAYIDACIRVAMSSRLDRFLSFGRREEYLWCSIGRCMETGQVKRLGAGRVVLFMGQIVGHIFLARGDHEYSRSSREVHECIDLPTLQTQNIPYALSLARDQCSVKNAQVLSALPHKVSRAVGSSHGLEELFDGIYDDAIEGIAQS